MSLILSLDTMGQRYGKLPSMLIKEASTFDLVIMDVAMTYERHVQKTNEPGYVPEIPLEDLIKINEGKFNGSY